MDHVQFVWDHFKFNVERRLKGFNFFILLSIFANGGVFSTLDREFNPFLLTLLGLFVIVLAAVFWIVDTRSRRLFQLTIPALRSIELEFPEPCRLFAIDSISQGNLIRYTFAFRILLACQLCFGVGVVAYGLSKLVT